MYQMLTQAGRINPPPAAPEQGNHQKGDNAEVSVAPGGFLRAGRGAAGKGNGGDALAAPICVWQGKIKFELAVNPGSQRNEQRKSERPAAQYQRFLPCCRLLDIFLDFRNNQPGGKATKRKSVAEKEKDAFHLYKLLGYVSMFFGNREESIVASMPFREMSPTQISEAWRRTYSLHQVATCLFSLEPCG